VSKTERLKGFGVARYSTATELRCMLDVVAVLSLEWMWRIAFHCYLGTSCFSTRNPVLCEVILAELCDRLWLAHCDYLRIINTNRLTKSSLLSLGLLVAEGGFLLGFFSPLFNVAR